MSESEPQEFPERAITAAQNLLKKGAEVVSQQTRSVRLQAQVRTLRDQKRKLYMTMGQKVYDLFQKDLVRNADLRLLCQQLTSLDAEIGLREEEMEQMRTGTRKRDTEGGIDSEDI
jgi:hypothetical protein